MSGADAVKLLIWYRPDGDAAVNLHQQQLVKEVGEQCVKYDIPFFLELLAYPGGNTVATAHISARTRRAKL